VFVKKKKTFNRYDVDVGSIITESLFLFRKTMTWR